MFTIAQTSEAINTTGGESGPLRQYLARQVDTTAANVSRQLSEYVETKRLIRICYGKKAFYMVMPPGPVDEVSSKILLSALLEKL